MFEKIIKISAPTAKSNDFEATNLITHLDSRTSGNNLKPQLDQIGTRATYNSCYKTTEVQLGPLGNKMIITINLGKPFLVHAMLVIQDLYTNDKLQNLEFYIGNNSDYT